MILQDTKKVFLWLFGIAFGGVTYLLLKGNYLFDVSNYPYIPLTVCLIIFILFFTIGIFVSKISNIFYLSLAKTKDLSQVEKVVLDEQKQKRLKKLIKNLKRILNYVLYKNYSPESVKVLSEYIGMDRDSTEKMVVVLRKTTTIRFIYWIVGIFLSSLNLILIYSLDMFQGLRQPMIIPISISLIIYLLFFIEGFLILKLPQKIYLDILNITEKSKEERQQALEKKRSELTEKESLQKRSIQNIRNTIKYLIEIGSNRDWILDLLISNGFSRAVAEDIMFQIIKENMKENEFKSKFKELKETNKTQELFIKKMHEDFENLRAVYQEVNSLKDYVYTLEDKEEKLDKFTNKKVEYTTLDKRTQPVDTRVSVINEIKNRADYANLQPAETKMYRRLTARQAQDELPKNIESDKQINFLYVLISPYAKRYTREELQSMMLSLGYSVAIIDDVLILLEQNGTEFKKVDNGLIPFVEKVVDGVTKKK